MEELIIWSARGQKICLIAAPGVHAVHPILPGPGKEFWPVYRFPRLSKNSRGGHVQLFFLSLQPQFRNLKEALPQLFKKCCSATATPQFRNRNFFLSPQL
jgi:hypothetical protein